MAHPHRVVRVDGVLFKIALVQHLVLLVFLLVLGGCLGHRALGVFFVAAAAVVVFAILGR